jgi:hypothetical protein
MGNDSAENGKLFCKKWEMILQKMGNYSAKNGK